MGALQSGEKSNFVLFIIYCLLVQVVFLSQALAYYDKKGVHIDAYDEQELKLLIEEQQTEIQVLDKQIQDVKKEIDWLVIKINRIADSGRKVPGQLKMSVDAKEKRVSVLTKEKRRLEVVVARFQARYATYVKDGDVQVSKPSSMMKPIATANLVPDAQKPAQITQPTFEKGKRSKIEAAIKAAGLGDWVDVQPADNGCVKLENTLPILFSSGSANLAREYQSFLKKLADFLKSYDVKIYVNGYADPDPIRTVQYPSNFELGASRAANVVHTLVKSGLKPSIFNIGTTGEHRFAAQIPSQQKSFQRRAELTVVFSG